ncbi:hypothetical protein EAH87_14380 [Sphingomonas koreensis]|nr:hypothetical protein EAH87_14380 [Sphingomonas koreensis]
MRTAEQVRAELDALEAIQALLAAIAVRTDPERRHELVQLRKRLAGQIMAVGDACECLFASDALGLAEFRRRYSAMRSATALHQAEWPAVRLGEVDDLYRQSALRARQANGVFANWLRARLGDQAPQGDGR